MFIVRSNELTNNIIHISGIVQGVGFRPFVYNLARKYGLGGYVYNDTKGVTVVIQGDPERIIDFARELRERPPVQSRIDSFAMSDWKTDETYRSFNIVDSRVREGEPVQISPDLDVCPDCLRELMNPGDRRYLYPFINCTNCGPRFTIIERIPYDRPYTTMRHFRMCPECRKEYDDPGNRRFHAQPNACPVCGPHIQLAEKDGTVILEGESAITNEKLLHQATQFLQEGKILAVKGIGGFHLACDALNETAVATLRKRKFREDKPFAVMFPDLQSAREYCQISAPEESALASSRRPIVLVRKQADRDLASSIAPRNQYIGAMRPYTPLHYLLMHFFKGPLVMTSGNISDEPVVYTNAAAFGRLSGIADVFLVHNRAIHMRCDDSVLRIRKGLEYPIRRSRGFVPDRIAVEWEFPEPVLACGPEQKNTFALARSNLVYLSHHIGDMENFETLQSFESGIRHFKDVLQIEPGIVAFDMHPDYLSTQYARAYPEKTAAGRPVRKIAVQHHHAHAVACMAENGLNRPVIAVVLDGTGYGTDGTIWGGEILLTEFARFRRLGHFTTVAMPGGKAAVRNPWQMALSYLFQLYGSDALCMDFPFLKEIDLPVQELILSLLQSGGNFPVTSSCGRLFDAAAAIAGVRNSVHYEGQAAVEFEQLVHEPADVFYHFTINRADEPFEIDWRPAVAQLVEDVRHAVPQSVIAAKFHNGLAHGLYEAVLFAAETTGIREIVLSGGVFMNRVLLTRLDNLLENGGFTVYTHRAVPANDGGIALGQAVIASAIPETGQEKGK